MKYLKYVFAAMIGSVIATCHAEELPAPIQMLANQGLTIVGEFSAPDGLQGYAAEFQGRPIALYLTAGGEHVLVGNMLNAAGQDIAAEPLYQLVTGPALENGWSRLESAELLQDGDINAPRIIYTITDPNCTFCHRFRDAAEPWIAAGAVQLRHLMVGIIRDESLPQAAAIMGSPNPAEALQEHMQRLQRGGIETAPRFVRMGEPTIHANHVIMRELNISSTPIVYYRDENNHVQMIRGMPRPEQIEAVFGPQP